MQNFEDKFTEGLTADDYSYTVGSGAITAEVDELARTVGSGSLRIEYRRVDDARFEAHVSDGGSRGFRQAGIAGSGGPATSAPLLALRSVRMCHILWIPSTLIYDTFQKK